MVKMIKIKIKKKQNNNIDTKPPNVFDYLKSLSQEAKDLMDEIKEADNDFNDYKLLFIGGNNKEFNVSIFRKPLSFLSAVNNGKICKKRQNFLKEKWGKNRRAKRL